MRVVAKQSRRTATGPGLAAGSARPELCRERRSHACGRLLALLLGVPGLFTAAPGLVVATPALLLGAFGLPTPAQAEYVVGKPRILTLTPGNGTLTLTWSSAISWESGTDSNGNTVAIEGTQAAVTGYDVHYTSSSTVDHEAAAGSDATTEWVAVNRSGATTSQTISGLSNGTPYRVRVRATHAGASSLWDGEWWGTPSAAKRPTNLTVTPGDGTLALTWAKGGGEATGYDVHYTLSVAGEGGSFHVGDDAEASGTIARERWVAVNRSGATTSRSTV